jgi:hypothetical protein
MAGSLIRGRPGDPTSGWDDSNRPNHPPNHQQGALSAEAAAAAAALRSGGPPRPLPSLLYFDEVQVRVYGEAVPGKGR